MSITASGFTADITGWINEIISKNRTLPFSRAKCEERSEGPLKRYDLTFRDGLGRIIATGEIKLPCEKGGWSPFDASAVEEGRAKALKASSKYFFTWNVNEFVLWKTTPTRSSFKDQDYISWRVEGIWKPEDLACPAAVDALRKWLPGFLNDLAKITTGLTPIRKKSPDVKLMDFLESALGMPVCAVLEELERRYGKARERSELNGWMRSDHGWALCDHTEGVRGNLERAARFACYGLAGKLVFHEALLGRHGLQIDRISVPDYIDTGEALHAHMEGYFGEAARVAGEFETFFCEDHTTVGRRIPFYSDAAVPFWRDLVARIQEFDFSKFECDVVGNILERLGSPEERQEFGRFYTRVEIIDLIDCFCGWTPEGKVLEPESGDLQAEEPVEKAAARQPRPRRGSRARLEELAAQVLEEIRANCPGTLRRYDPDFLDKQKPFDTFELPAEGEPEPYKDLFNKRGVVFRKGKKRTALVGTKNPAQDDLVIGVARSGIRGFVRIPREEDECMRVLDAFSTFAAERRQAFLETIAAHAEDEETREKILAALMQMISDKGL